MRIEGTWHQLTKQEFRVPTGKHHEFVVHREQVPIIVVPDIMGTQLQTSNQKKDRIWDPDSPGFMFKKLGLFTVDAHNKQKLVLDSSGQFVANHAVPDEDDHEHNRECFNARHPTSEQRSWSTLAWSIYQPLLKALAAHT